MWVDSTNCCTIIMDSWNGTAEGANLKLVIEKINWYNVILGDWNREAFKPMRKTIQQVRTHLKSLLEADPKGTKIKEHN